MATTALLQETHNGDILTEQSILELILGCILLHAEYTLAKKDESKRREAATIAVKVKMNGSFSSLKLSSSPAEYAEATSFSVAPLLPSTWIVLP